MVDEVMDDTLKPLIADGLECIEQEDYFVVAEDNEEPWKLILLICIVLKAMLMLAGVLHQRSLLRDEKMISEKYATLPKIVTDILPMDQLRQARKYNIVLNSIDITWHLANLIFDFVVIFFDLPAAVWFGWLKVLRKGGNCGVEAETFYDHYGQVAVGVLLYLTFRTCKELYLTPIRLYELSFEKRMGFSEATCCQQIMIQLFDYAQKLFMEVPSVVIAGVTIVAMKKFFAVAAFGLTALVFFVQIWINRTLCVRCENVVRELGDDQKLLKYQVEQLCKRVDFQYESISLIESRMGDLHSNASVSDSKVQMSDQLLEHHKGHNEEILAILAHEIGHSKKYHIYRMVAINCFYMLIYGLILIPVIEHNPFLAAFNIYHESYFLTLAYFTFFYTQSIDVFIRLFINQRSRKHELQADEYSVRIGFGDAQYKALVRNFAQNKDIVFQSGFNNALTSTHPALLKRLSTIEKLNHELKKLVEPAREIELRLNGDSFTEEAPIEGVSNDQVKSYPTDPQRKQDDQPTEILQDKTRSSSLGRQNQVSHDAKQ